MLERVFVTHLAVVTQVTRRWRPRRPSQAPQMFSREGPPAPGSASAAATGLHRTAAEGPQPETLFRPGATQLAGRGAGGGEREGEAGPELPGFELPTPRYDDEEEAVPRHAPPPPEPENPLPDLPPNHPDEAPKGPEPEVPIPRQDPEADPLAHPPEVVPGPGPVEVPGGAPVEWPPATAPPEFSPGGPSELPERGGSEINFP